LVELNQYEGAQYVHTSVGTVVPTMWANRMQQRRYAPQPQACTPRAACCVDYCGSAWQSFTTLALPLKAFPEV
jgi:hypothetical protein